MLTWCRRNGVSIVVFSLEYVNKNDKILVVMENVYYEVIENIFYLSYCTQFTIHLFQCRWVYLNYDVKKYEYDFLTLINFNQIGDNKDPFKMVSYAKNKKKNIMHE